jgi:hypothetical protein
MGKRKKRGEPFVKLTRFMVTHPSWYDLSPGARCIYIELRRRFNGINNGEITLSCREAAMVAKCGKGTATKLLNELTEHGYIKPEIRGRFRNRFASTWRLTNEEYHGQQKTDDWVRWKKERKL